MLIVLVSDGFRLSAVRAVCSSALQEHVVTMSGRRHPNALKLLGIYQKLCLDWTEATSAITQSSAEIMTSYSIRLGRTEMQYNMTDAYSDNSHNYQQDLYIFDKNDWHLKQNPI